MLATFQLSGPDAARYLNGQVTNDVTKATETQFVEACITDAKGKLQALATISQTEKNTFSIQVSCEDSDAIFERLDRYLIADDCELTLLTTEPSPEVPTSENDRRILEGKAGWGTEIIPGILPPEAGLDKTHIAYDKGCYIGQEVISRIKSVGRVNRSLYQLTLTPAEPNAMGKALQNDEAKPVGEITSITSDGKNAIAYVHRKAEAISIFSLEGSEAKAYREAL